MVDYGRLWADIVQVYERAFFGPRRSSDDFPVFDFVILLSTHLLLTVLAAALGCYLRRRSPNQTPPPFVRFLDRFFACYGRLPRHRSRFSPSTSISGSKVSSFGGGFNISRNSTRFC